MRYFLYGYYGYDNLGDDLLLWSLIRGIRATDAQASFVVRSRGMPHGFENEDRVVFTQAERVIEDKGGAVGKLWFALREFWLRVAEADVVVLGGGTLFLDKGRFSITLLLMFALALFARWQMKKLIVTGVAVDVLTHPVSLLLTRRILALADFVAVRDALSWPYVEHRPRGMPTRLAADLVLGLALPIDPTMPTIAPGKKPCLGICLIDYYRQLVGAPEEHAAYRDAVLQFVRKHRAEYVPVLITLQVGRGLCDDWALADLQRECPELEVIHLGGLADVSLLKGLAVIATMRFHLGLLGVMQVIPVVVIDHELKMTALAKDFGLPSVTLAEFVANPALLDVSAMLESYNPARTARCLAEQRLRAARNFDWLRAGFG